MGGQILVKVRKFLLRRAAGDQLQAGFFLGRAAGCAIDALGLAGMGRLPGGALGVLPKLLGRLPGRVLAGCLRSLSGLAVLGRAAAAAAGRIAPRLLRARLALFIRGQGILAGLLGAALRPATSGLVLGRARAGLAGGFFSSRLLGCSGCPAAGTPAAPAAMGSRRILCCFFHSLFHSYTQPMTRHSL